MGNYANKFTDYKDNTVADKTSPEKGDWIIAHSAASGLAIVEVERLWARFKQMGCTDDGTLTQDVFEKPPASNDIFCKNILRMMVDKNGLITFQAFLNAMSWAESASTNDKLNAVFNMLNNGNNVPKDITQRIVARLYPDNSENDNSTIVNNIYEEMDWEGKGVITRAQWTYWAGSIPGSELDTLLAFAVVPPEINAEAHRSFTSQSTSKSSHQLVTDAIVADIAKKIFERDWHVLANQLHFTAQELQGFQEAYEDDTQRQAYMMLRNWKLREGKHATVKALERALQLSKMSDVSMTLI